MADLVQKIERLDNDFSEVWVTTPSGFSAGRVWDCQQCFAVPLLLMPTGRLVTGTDVFGCVSVDKEMKRFGLLVVLCVCVCIAFYF